MLNICVYLWTILYKYCNRTCTPVLQNLSATFLLVTDAVCSLPVAQLWQEWFLSKAWKCQPIRYHVSPVMHVIKYADALTDMILSHGFVTFEASQVFQ